MKSLICNLKMNHNLQEMLEYKKILEENANTSFLLCPPTCYLPLMHSKYYKLCAQNVSTKEKETLTGGISLDALKSLDTHSVLLGHKEVEESFEVTLEKVEHVTNKNAYAYVILSDTEEEFNYQYTTSVLLEKIDNILSCVKKDKYYLLTFIYEPSWIVGTNFPLDIEIVNNIIYKLKKELKAKYSIDFKIYYGGGLTMETINPFLESEYIDGLLLGSLSFDAKNVVKILKSEEIRQN